MTRERPQAPGETESPSADAPAVETVSPADSTAADQPRGEPQGPVGGAESPIEATDAAADDERLTRTIDQLQRLQAEFDNYRKRTLRERQEWQRRAQADLLTRLLPVLDDFDRARAHLGMVEAGSPVEGLVLVLKRLEDAISQSGLVKLTDQPGDPFDPERHEAVQASPSSEIEEGRILMVFESGYAFEGQVLRPSKVKVSSGEAE